LVGTAAELPTRREWVATLDPVHYTNPRLLVNGQELYVDHRFGMQIRGNYFRDWLGQGLDEKWLQGADDQWYYITLTGDLLTRDHVRLASLDGETHTDPAGLHDARNLVFAGW